jgi:hypothetical protein
MPWNRHISDKRVIGAASGISRQRILNDFFHNANAVKFISPENFSLITQLTAIILLPRVKQNNQERVVQRLQQLLFRASSCGGVKRRKPFLCQRNQT